MLYYNSTANPMTTEEEQTVLNRLYFDEDDGYFRNLRDNINIGDGACFFTHLNPETEVYINVTIYEPYPEMGRGEMVVLTVQRVISENKYVDMPLAEFLGF